MNFEKQHTISHFHNNSFPEMRRNPFPKSLTFSTQSNIPPIQATKLIKFYCDKGQLGEARQVFDEMTRRDVITWTAMIAGYTTNGNNSDAWMVFCDMKRDGMGPNAFTASNVLKACKGMECWFCGAAVHGVAVKHGVDGCMYVENALLDMYATCGGSMDDACLVFDGIRERTAVTWTTMIAGYTKRGEGFLGIQVFLRMLQQQEDLALNPFTCSIAIRACASFGSLILGKQFHAIIYKYGFKDNLPVSNSIVDMYCRCMSLSEAKQYFNDMHQKDLITRNTMIAGLETFGSYESLKLFAQMVLLDVYPNCFTYTSIIAACANFAFLNCGQQVHGVIIRRGFGWNTPLANALIDMYAKCGCIVDSRRIFDEMKRRDLVSWTSMMTGYGNHGYGREAVELFDDMVVSGITPDHVVFIGVLCACSHAGLVEEGLKYFNSMKTYNVCPNMEIYGCIVDLLGRAGRVTDAYELIEKMPFEADESIWGALLGSCKVHRNTDLGKMAGQKILNLRPNAAETYVILSNIYAADRKWGEFAMMRKVMRGIGSKKEAGRSWIEVGNRVYSFAVGQRSSPHLDLVYEGLEILAWHMKEAGCVAD